MLGYSAYMRRSTASFAKLRRINTSRRQQFVPAMKTSSFFAWVALYAQTHELAPCAPWHVREDMPPHEKVRTRASGSPQ